MILKRVLGRVVMAAVIVGGASASVIFSQATQPGAASGTTFQNPLILQRADPHVYKHTDGYYYFMGTVPEYDRLELRRAKTIQELETAEPKVVWRKHATGEMGSHIWAPEIHFIEGKWYIYFAAGGADQATTWRIRTYALENASANPLEGEWAEKGMVNLNWNQFALDSTVVTHKGTRYMVWAEKDPAMPRINSNLYIAKMATPTSIEGRGVMISQPTLPWETVRFAVNEGAAVIHRNGRLFMTYSASATDANYAVGMLTADENADLLDPASWKKSPEPVLKTDEAAGVFGPGHNCFTTSPDGKEDIFVYHARSYRDIPGDPLNNPDRHTRAQVITWNVDGTPRLSPPVADAPGKKNPAVPPTMPARGRGRRGGG